MRHLKIGVLVGSARRNAYSMVVAKTLVNYLPDGFAPTFFNLDRLPMFLQDYDDDNATPPIWSAFRSEVRAVDAVLFVTPEYNRSFPPLLKNAIDIASRPMGRNAWAGKPGALVGVSPGRQGGISSCQHLRQTLSFLDILLMNQPEVNIGGIAEALDEDGNIVDEGILGFLKICADSYAAWVQRFVER